MDFLKDRRVAMVLAGAAIALLAGLAVAFGLMRGHRGEGAPPPASQGGLVIDTSGSSDGRMDAAKPLRCFVAGQFVGELTLTDCARRNGVATDALDVGLDQTGALAAADQAGAMITPLPPTEAAPVAGETADAGATPMVEPPQAAPCWRYVDAQWRRLPGDMPLAACVQTLFAGRCERPGGATYGRWAQQTLRLVPGKVESSPDNRSFHSIADQAASCAIGAVG